MFVNVKKQTKLDRRLLNVSLCLVRRKKMREKEGEWRVVSWTVKSYPKLQRENLTFYELHKKHKRDKENFTSHPMCVSLVLMAQVSKSTGSASSKSVKHKHCWIFLFPSLLTRTISNFKNKKTFICWEKAKRERERWRLWSTGKEEEKWYFCRIKLKLPEGGLYWRWLNCLLWLARISVVIYWSYSPNCVFPIFLICYFQDFITQRAFLCFVLLPGQTDGF